MDRPLAPHERTARTRRRTLPLLLAVTLAAGALFALPRVLRPSFERANLRLVTVTRGNLEAVLSTTGTVVPAGEEVLTAPVDGTLVRVDSRPGDRLAPGTAILTLDAVEAELALSRLAEQAAQRQNAATQATLASRREQARLAAERDRQRLDRELAALRLAQRQRLAAEGLVATEALREAEVAHRKAEIELATSEEELAMAASEAEARNAALSSELRLLAAEQKAAADRLQAAALVSPRAGVLTWVRDEIGAAVRAGDPLARLADLSAFRVEAALSDQHAGRLAVGQPVRVTLAGEVLAGRLARIDPAVASGTVRFHVELARRDHPALRPELRVDVDVVVAERPEVLLLGRGPAVRSESTLALYVLDGTQARRREVRLGLGGRDAVEVLAGLSPGDVVIASDLGSDLRATTIDLED
jgi:HlyD family secretion protein